VNAIPVEARDAVAFVWSGQDGLFELAYETDKRRYFSRDKALTVLDEYRYFAPLARRRRGSKKKDVAATGNVLWADIDHLGGLEDRLRRLAPISPSLVVFSGRKGFWVYLKLNEAIPSDEIELLNTGLETLLGADSCHNIDRIARLPGSIHQESGKQADVVEFSGVVYSLADLAFLKDLAPAKASRPTEAVFGRTAPVLSGFPKEFAALSSDLRLYIERSPRHGEHGYDRSRMEQKIFTALAYQGWADDEIITFATVYRLPRHIQEWSGHKNYSWTERSIKKVREWITAHPPSPNSFITKSMCMEGDSKGSYTHSDRYKALRLVTGDQRTKELIHTLMTKLPNQPTERTAYRVLWQLRGAGYIRKEGKTWILTEAGIHHTSTKMNYLMVLPKIPRKQAN
jgi:hypothetical protein